MNGAKKNCVNINKEMMQSLHGRRKNVRKNNIIINARETTTKNTNVIVI